MNVTFEGQPRGTISMYGMYSTAGVQFSIVSGPGSIVLSGGGRSGYPDNGTGYLEMPDNTLTFRFASGAYFDVLAFDAAEFGGRVEGTVEMIGYGDMGLRVTNLFTLDGINDGLGPLQDFQTLQPDSRFRNLYRVDVYGRWSLDNLVIGGVPEPSAGALVVLGFLCAFARCRMRTRRR